MNADEVSSSQESAIGSPLTKAVRQLGSGAANT